MYTAADFEPGLAAAGKSELEPLLDDVPKEVPWASEALGESVPSTELPVVLTDASVDRTPDAVNVWIGGSRSVTSVHSGNMIVYLFL